VIEKKMNAKDLIYLDQV